MNQGDRPEHLFFVAKGNVEMSFMKNLLNVGCFTFFLKTAVFLVLSHTAVLCLATHRCCHSSPHFVQTTWPKEATCSGGKNVLSRDVVRLSARETILIVHLRPMQIGSGA